ncbi:hypothetical protein HXZ62_09750 [Empedobacter falsenii]|uniref:hypothetical protein n=1 Tax=Empedobacter falsenii TaxID=343874 RepID=UPI0025749802|nr:hypothetical protein [Empedobacter falsenii]MDM1062840.1 hypothetical protein [Empedobacter falsenii]
MGRKNKKSKKEDIAKNTIRKEFVSTKTSNLISILLFVIAFVFYKKNELILFNVGWRYYIVLFIFSLIFVFLILNIPILKRKLVETGYWKDIVLISIYYSIFLSISFYYGSKYIVNDLAKDQIITEHCEILEVKKGRYRRSGDYYKLKVNFKGKEETIDLDENLYQKLEKVSLTENNAIIKVRPSIFNIYVVENVLIESKNHPK